jgi:hypothetical protein
LDLGVAQGRKQKGGEDRDNGDDDKQFDQSERGIYEKREGSATTEVFHFHNTIQELTLTAIVWVPIEMLSDDMLTLYIKV